MKVTCEVLGSATSPGHDADAAAQQGATPGKREKKVKQAGKRDSVTALAGYDDHSSGP
jgi:hypothetical protein